MSLPSVAGLFSDSKELYISCLSLALLVLFGPLDAGRLLYESCVEISHSASMAVDNEAALKVVRIQRAAVWEYSGTTHSARK
jgi:hypothetical protein